VIDVKVSDYVVDFLYKQNIQHVFCVTGGAIAHLIDSADKHHKMEYVCHPHEQAAAMAADGYARVTRNMGAAFVTTGPGVTNLITGIASLYYDSVPSIFIAGQVSRFRLTKNTPGVRQLGFQESPHVDLVAPITKYASLVDDPSRIRYELEKAVWIANEGRPGPVFIDVCDDVQREEIDPDSLLSFAPPSPKPVNADLIDSQIAIALEMIAKAERPILVLGAAVKLARVEDKARAFADRLGIPVALTWATMDLFSSDHPLNTGGFGVSSTRRGNFAIQNSDLILSIGSRLDTHATGTPLSSFARDARKIVVELEPAEANKFVTQGLDIDVLITADVRDFFISVDKNSELIPEVNVSDWIEQVRKWRIKFPTNPDEFSFQKALVNPYTFFETLAEHTGPNEIIIADTGAAVVQLFQGFPVREGQRLLTAFNNTPMGYSLAGSIGACFANGREQIICIIGDGGLQANLQELLTVKRHELPIKIFVFNNHGYGIIQQTQDDWLDSRYVGSRESGGLADPDYAAIGVAIGIKSVTISSHEGMSASIREILDTEEPVLCILDLDPDQRIVPMLKAGRPIEDANPLLDRQTFKEQMIVKPMEASMSGE
jgi:acetolactate synthase I/II/III large subunit